jgi:hypothetical protein
VVYLTITPLGHAKPHNQNESMTKPYSAARSTKKHSESRTPAYQACLFVHHPHHKKHLLSHGRIAGPLRQQSKPPRYALPIARHARSHDHGVCPVEQRHHRLERCPRHRLDDDTVKGCSGEVEHHLGRFRLTVDILFRQVGMVAVVKCHTEALDSPEFRFGEAGCEGVGWVVPGSKAVVALEDHDEAAVV